MSATKAQAIQAIRDTEQFIGPAQRMAILHAMGGEEKQFFFDLAVAYAARIAAMPKTYETDGLVYLHYFKGGCDWWVTEKDSDKDGRGQVQAFGFVNLGDPQSAESGYLSIRELIHAGVELDLYWEPVPLSEIQKKVGV